MKSNILILCNQWKVSELLCTSDLRPQSLSFISREINFNFFPVNWFHELFLQFGWSSPNRIIKKYVKSISTVLLILHQRVSRKLDYIHIPQLHCTKKLVHNHSNCPTFVMFNYAVIGRFRSFLGRPRKSTSGQVAKNRPDRPRIDRLTRLAWNHCVLNFGKHPLVKCTHLTPNVTCKRVTIPLTKNKVDMIYPLAGSSSEMQRSGVKMNGIDTVAPNIVLHRNVNFSYF